MKFARSSSLKSIEIEKEIDYRFSFDLFSRFAIRNFETVKTGEEIFMEFFACNLFSPACPLIISIELLKSKKNRAG